MEQIHIIENIKGAESYDLRYRFAIPTPQKFANLADKTAMLNSYRTIYPSLEGLTDGFVTFQRQKTFEYTQTALEVKTYLLMEYQMYQNDLENLEVQVPDELNGLVWNGTEWL